MGQPALRSAEVPETVGYRVLDAFIQPALAGLARLPHRRLLAVARRAADLATGLGFRRRVMRDNLDLVFGSAFPEDEKRRIARSAMRNLFQSVVEILRASHPRSAREAAGYLRLEPRALVEDLGRDPRPLLLAVAHSGNFDLAGAAFIRETGRPLGVVMKRLNSLATTRLLVEGRRAIGFEVFGTWDPAVLRRVIRRLRAGAAVCMLPDQYARSTGVVVPFLGHPASTHTGPAFAALKAPGTRLVVAVDARIDDGPHHVCHLEEIEGIAASGDTRADVTELTRRINDTMSRMLEKVPESYLWQHRRWRVPGTRPAWLERLPRHERPPKRRKRKRR